MTLTEALLSACATLAAVCGLLGRSLLLELRECRRDRRKLWAALAKHSDTEGQVAAP